jgi:hypothetical protein
MTLGELERGRTGVIELVGERGIGKARLPRELATRRSRLEHFEPDPRPRPGERSSRAPHRPSRDGRKGAYS